MDIKVKYHNKELLPLEKTENGDWIDLRSVEDVTMKKGEHKYISLGVSIELPNNYEAYIVPRSSTYKNFGIIQANHLGVIDESFCGNNDIWKFSAIALKNTIINKNDRICQFRIIKKQPNIEFIEVKNLGNEDRGGFGSTGIK